MNCPVPKMILQPVVENAIYHGLEPKIGSGCLTISSMLKDGELMLRIEDDGVGMNKENIAVLNKLLADHEPFPSGDENGVGLANTHRRIQMKYGYDYGLAFDSMEGEGTVMKITLPAGGAGLVPSIAR